MRQDKFDIRKALKHVREQEIHCGAGRIERVADSQSDKVTRLGAHQGARRAR